MSEYLFEIMLMLASHIFKKHHWVSSCKDEYCWPVTEEGIWKYYFSKLENIFVNCLENLRILNLAEQKKMLSL